MILVSERVPPAPVKFYNAFIRENPRTFQSPILETLQQEGFQIVPKHDRPHRKPVDYRAQVRWF